MTQIPAGWYPDPDPQAPEPKGQRWWDGQRWTEHVYPPPGQAAPGQYGQGEPGQGAYSQGQPDQGQYGQGQYGTDHPDQGQYGQGQYGQGGYAQGPYAADQFGGTGFTPGAPQPPSRAYAPMSPYAGAAQTARATTPDGQELAGWWMRALAFVIDSIIVGFIGGLLAFPWVSQLVDLYTDFVSEAIDAAEAGSTTIPGQTEFITDIAGPLFVVSFIGLAVSLAYQVVFLRWKAATPGKLLLSLRVRLRERPGQLAYSTILKRWVGQFGYALFTAVPVLGNILGFYPLVNYLWPVFDSKKQALHDKLAATNVVRQRGDTWTPAEDRQTYPGQQAY